MQKNLATDTLEIKLSYILTTYNKLPYLQTTLPYLVEACRPDEEIVIVDGGSSDGTAAYLEALLQHKEIDMCGTDGFGVSTQQQSSPLVTSYGEGFTEWKKTGAPFLFCGLSYMIRRASISRLGLLSTQYKMIDFEYSIRVSALQAHIVFCSAYSFVNIVSADSNSSKFYENIKIEKNKLEKIYPNISNLNNSNNLYLGFKEKIRKIIRLGKQPAPDPASSQADYQNTVKSSLEILKKKNSGASPTFL